MKNRELQQKIIDRLIEKFEFKEKKDFLRYGRCPACGKKELYAPIAYPRFIKCGRLNNCGYEGDAKEIFKDLYEDLNDKYKPTPQNPNATADAYMELHRGFNPRLLKGAYRQGSFYSHYAKKAPQQCCLILTEQKRSVWSVLSIRFLSHKRMAV